MKATYFYAAGALALTAIVAACSSGVSERYVQTAPVATPAPTPTPTPTPVPAPPPRVVNEPMFENYLDAPQTPGTWLYADQSNGSMAVFQSPDRTPLLMLECDRVVNGIMLFRSSNGQSTRNATIRTETTQRSLQMQSSGPGHSVWFGSRDPLLDAMAITKGRIAIGVEGERTLYLPAWVEISRVIEDCR